MVTNVRTATVMATSIRATPIATFMSLWMAAPSDAASRFSVMTPSTDAGTLPAAIHSASSTFTVRSVRWRAPPTSFVPAE